MHALSGADTGFSKREGLRPAILIAGGGSASGPMRNAEGGGGGGGLLYASGTIRKAGGRLLSGRGGGTFWRASMKGGLQPPLYPPLQCLCYITQSRSLPFYEEVRALGSFFASSCGVPPRAAKNIWGRGSEKGQCIL